MLKLKLTKFRIGYLVIILSLLLTDTSLIAWNRGFDLGYEAGLGDVLLGFVNPLDYFMKKYPPHIPKKGTLNGRSSSN